MNQDLPSFHEDLSPSENRKLFVSGMDASDRGRYTAIVALTSLDRTRGYERLRFGDIYAFAHKTAGLSRRDVNNMLRVGRALSRLRKIDEAFRTGTLCWSKVRLVAQVATKKTEDHWLARAKKRTSTQLEHMVARKAEPIVKHDYVATPAIPIELQKKLTYLYGLVRRKEGDSNLSDEECLDRIADLAAEKLVAPEVTKLTEPASAPAGTEAARSRDIPTEPAPVPAETEATRSREVPRHIRRAALRRACYRCETPGCGNTISLEADHVIEWPEGGTHDLKDLKVRCLPCHSARHRKEAEPGGDDASAA